MDISSKKHDFVSLQTLGQWIPALLLIGFSYVSSDNAEVAVALLTIAVGINAAPYLGFQVK